MQRIFGQDQEAVCFRELKHLGGLGFAMARTLSAAVSSLVSFGVLADIVHFGCLAPGIEVPPVQRAPVIALTTRAIRGIHCSREYSLSLSCDEIAKG